MTTKFKGTSILSTALLDDVSITILVDVELIILQFVVPINTSVDVDLKLGRFVPIMVTICLPYAEPIFGETDIMTGVTVKATSPGAYFAKPIP